MGDVLDIIGDYVAPIALGFVPGIGPALSAVYTGVKTGVETGNPLSGFLGAAGSFAGNALGSSLGSSFGDAVGGTAGQTLNSTPANALGSIFGGDTMAAAAPFGSFAGNALGGSSIGSMLGAGLGSSAGESIGSQLGGQLNPMQQASAPNPSNAFSASRSPQMGLPQSLSQFSNLDPFQQATNIASKGVYGGGNGANENSYFLNLINRQLVDDGNNVKGMDSLNPVESGYLSQLGLSGYNNSNDLLKGISQYAG